MKRLRPIISLLFAYASLWIYPSHSIQFQHPSFDDICDFRIVKQDAWYTGVNVSFISGSGIWLTPDPNDAETLKPNNLGQFLYKDPIQFIFDRSDSPKKVVSFNTNFTFQIITTRPYSECANGMAFFISALDKAPNNSGGYGLGLVNRDAALGPNPFANVSNLFAVEFDTHNSSSHFYDPGASHIGIDINSLISSNYTDTSPDSSHWDLDLYRNLTFQAWIDYSSSINLIQVWMTTNTSERPSQAVLQLTHNLSSVCSESMLNVGFSATNMAANYGMQGLVVSGWSFSSEDLTKKPKHSKLIVRTVIAVLSILALGGFIFIIALFVIKKKWRMRTNGVPFFLRTRSEDSIIQLGSNRCNLPRYSYKEMKRCAQGFTDRSKVGEGGYSSVYRATFADGSVMSIKRLKEGVRKEAEFCAEMNIISSICHRNLLQLHGWCYEKGEAMLVYKYMTNGSLERYLYGKKQGELQSEMRLKILVGVASALEYLHGNLGECVLHRDVKAANVLLTDRFEPKLSDFGLAHLIGHDQGAVTMTAVGTPGYVPPEVVYTGRATDKADVYSFGVLTLEMAYGRPALDLSNVQPKDALIVDYVWMLHQRNQLIEALDPSMCIDMMPLQKEQWKNVLHLALMCCNPLPESRPSMRQVSQALKGDTVLLMEALPATRPLYPICPDWPSASGSFTSLTSQKSVTISTSEAGGSSGGCSSTASK